MADQDQIEGLPEGATVRALPSEGETTSPQPTSGASKIEGLPEGATVRALPPASPEHTMGGAGGSFEPQSTASKVWETTAAPLVPAGRAEKEGKALSESAPTLAESEHPVWTGIKKGVAGAYADAAEARRYATAPLALATLGMGALAGIPGELGTVAKYGSRLAGLGFGAQGAEQAVEGGMDIAKNAQMPNKGNYIPVSPEDARKTLMGAAMVAGGAAAGVHGTAIGNERAGKVLAAPVRAAARLGTALQPQLPTIVGLAAGEAVGHPYLGAIAGRTVLPKDMFEGLLERGRNLGFNDEEANINHLQERYNQAVKEAVKPEREYKAHDAGRQQGIPAPDDVLKAHEKAQKNLADASEHLKAAVEDYEAKITNKTAPVAAQAPLTLTPDQQAAQAARVPKAPAAPITPANVKLPGQIQPETFPQTPTERPVVIEARMPLAGNQGMMGRQKLLTEGTPEGPAPAPALAVAETPTRERMVAPRPGRLGSLKVDETGKIVDKETPLQRSIEEGLQGIAKPVAIPPAGEELPEFTERTGKRLGVPEPIKEDIGAKVRGEAPPLPRGERRTIPRTAEENANTDLFRQARKDLGEDATNEQIDARMKELKEAKGQPKGEASPEDMSKVEQTVAQLPNQDLQRLGGRFGVDESKYDFSKREAVREGGSKHAVDRDRFAKDAHAALPEALKNEIVDATNAWDKNNPQTFDAPARSSKFWADRSRAIMQDALTRYQDSLSKAPGGPKTVAGGAPEEAEEKPLGTSEEAKAEEKAGPKGFPDYKEVADYHNENKGFTYNMEKGFMKDQPGFSVAGEFPGTEKVFPSPNLQAKDIQAYVERPDVKAALEADPKNSVGGWTYKGKSHLEVSKLYNDMGDALDAAKKNNQTSIFDHEHKQEIPTGGSAAEEAQAKAKEKPGAPGALKPYKDMTPEEQEALAAKGVSGGAPSKKLPTGDELIKKYGESNGDPAQTAFILKDGRGVAQTGNIHDEMLGGKTTNKESPREAFIDQGNIRIRARSAGRNGRETSISIPESGITLKQLDYLKKMSPQLQSGVVVIEVGKVGGAYRMLDDRAATPDVLEKTLRELAPITPEGYPKGTPEVSGGSGAASKAEAKELPKLAEEHGTAEELAGATKTPRSTEKFVDVMSKIPEVHEYVDIANAGAGARKWYQRSTQAFDAMKEEAPEYFKEDGDRDKFINLLAASSPRQSVAMNLREALRTWKEYVDAGRPTGEPLKDLLTENLTPARSKVPNALKAINGEEMWPDITKNSAFKVPSFARNLRGWLNSVTNDGWMSLFAGINPKDISSAHSYHPLSIATRAAAHELGWEPAEAQAAIWSFTQALTERGEDLPEEVRKQSEDFVDLLKNDPQVRSLLSDLGVSHANLDAKLAAIGEKPEISSRTSPTTARSIERLKNRIETARGEGAVPPPKSAQGKLNLGYREPPAHESRGKVRDEDVEFNPAELESDSKMIPKNRRMNARGAQ